MIHKVDQGSQAWLDLKKGRITGTRLKQVMGKDSGKLLCELIAEKYESIESYQSPEMSDGVLKESWAIDAYQEKTGQIVREIGFITKGEDLGLSPDGLIGEKKAIEVKCPSLTKHIEYLLLAKNNKIPVEYKWQVTHYFVVIDELEELDFVSHHPKFPTELSIVTVKRSEIEEDIKEAKAKIETFLKKYNQAIAELL